MHTVTAVAIGAVFGALQIALLISGVRSLGGGHIRIWPFVVQFFCPMAGLLGCAWLARERLAVCAVTIVAVLICGAAAEMVSIKRRNSKKVSRGDRDE